MITISNSGLNYIGISVQEDMTDVASLDMIFTSLVGDTEYTFMAGITNYDCYTGALILGVFVGNVPDGEYSVAFSNAGDILHTSLQRVLMYTYVVNEDTGVVSGVTDSDAMIVTEDGLNFLTTEDGKILTI